MATTDLALSNHNADDVAKGEEDSTLARSTKETKVMRSSSRQLVMAFMFQLDFLLDVMCRAERLEDAALVVVLVESMKGDLI